MLRAFGSLPHVTIAGIVAVVLLGILTGFQLALALGAPLGAAAWGGQNPGVLPTRLRVASAIVGLVVYPLIGVVVLSASGLLDIALPFDTGIAMWVLAAFFALGAIVNGISRSAAERIWSPVSAILAVCCAVIALGL